MGPQLVIVDAPTDSTVCTACYGSVWRQNHKRSLQARAATTAQAHLPAHSRTCKHPPTPPPPPWRPEFSSRNSSPLRTAKLGPYTRSRHIPHSYVGHKHFYGSSIGLKLQKQRSRKQAEMLLHMRWTISGCLVNLRFEQRGVLHPQM